MPSCGKQEGKDSQNFPLPSSQCTMKRTCPTLGQELAVHHLETWPQYCHTFYRCEFLERHWKPMLFKIRCCIMLTTSFGFFFGGAVLTKYLAGMQFVNWILHISLKNSLVSLEYRVLVQLAYREQLVHREPKWFGEPGIEGA